MARRRKTGTTPVLVLCNSCKGLVRPFNAPRLEANLMPEHAETLRALVLEMPCECDDWSDEEGDYDEN